MTDYLVPALLLLSSGLALGRRRDSYGALLEGGAQGLELMASIVPPLVMLLTAFGLLRASGALELLTNFTAPLLTRLGIPSECAPLILIRPFSGSAALAVGAELIAPGAARGALARIAPARPASDKGHRRHPNSHFLYEKSINNQEMYIKTAKI